MTKQPAPLGTVLREDKRSWMEIHVDTVAALVAERDEALAALREMRDALEHARDQNLAGREAWGDDPPILAALETARSIFSNQEKP